MLVIEYRVELRGGGTVDMCGRFKSWDDFHIFKRANMGNNGKRWVDVWSLSVIHEKEN